MATRRTRISVADLLIQPEPQQRPRPPPDDDDVVLLDVEPVREPDRQTGPQLTGQTTSSSTSPPQNTLSPTHTATSYYRSPTRYGVPPRPNYYEPYIARTATKPEPAPPIFIQQLQPPASPPPVILFRATLPVRSAPTTSHPKPYKVPEWARTNTATKPKLIKDGKVIDAVVESEFERKKVARDLVRKKDKERKRIRKRANRRDAPDSLPAGNGNAMATGSGSGMSATPDPEPEVAIDKGNMAMAVDTESISISAPADAPPYSDSEEANFDQYLQYPSSSPPPPPPRHTSTPSAIPVPTNIKSSSDIFIFPPQDTSASHPTTASTTPGTTESPKTPP